MSIALATNVYNDAAALRGLLETGSRYFDNIYVIHSGPGCAHSTDGTIELCEEFGISPVFRDIQEGFGSIRSELIHDCGCDWAFVLDADERFFPSQPVLLCTGNERYPDNQNPDLTVIECPNLVYPGQDLKRIILRKDIDAIKTIRRHWFDFGMKRPAENWEIIKDWQMRIVRNVPHIGYAAGVKMHERLVDLRTNEEPRHATGSINGGPFHDHFHLHFRPSGRKEFNERNYQRLERGEPMLEQPTLFETKIP